MCEKFKLESVKFEKLHFSSWNQQMKFISMDLIGEFYLPTSRGHRYTLFVMLTGKGAEDIIQASLNKVYYCFGGSRKLLSNNGTEFKNKLFDKVAQQL